MAKAKKSTGNGRKSSNVKPPKRAPRAAAKRNTAIPAAAPRRAAANGARSTAQRAQQQLQRPQVQPQTQSLPSVSGEITQDMIARRAYEIYLSDNGGSEFDNWCRAERELRGT